MELMTEAFAFSEAPTYSLITKWKPEQSAACISIQYCKYTTINKKHIFLDEKLFSEPNVRERSVLSFLNGR